MIKRQRSKRKTTKERVKEEEEADQQRKEQLEKEFQELWDNLGDFDPYEGLNIDKCDGKIQVTEGDGKDEESKDVKYRYFIKARKLVDE